MEATLNMLVSMPTRQGDARLAVTLVLTREKPGAEWHVTDERGARGLFGQTR
jgi:hypothetical protein